MTAIARRWTDFRARAGANPWFARGLLAALAVAVFDQATKHWILYGLKLQDRPFGRIEISPIFDLTMVWNRGVSFGLLSGGAVARVGLTVFSLAIATALTVWLARLDRAVAAIGAGLVAGGALGNAYDRAVYGAVVDFLDFSGLHFPWVFNVADAAINVGVACLIADAVFHREAPKG